MSSSSRRLLRLVLAGIVFALTSSVAVAQTGRVSGVVTDETGAVLPGVDVRAAVAGREALATVTDAAGRYEFDGVPPGTTQFTFSMLNFGTVRRDVTVTAGAPARVDIVLHYVLSADVTVTGRRTFTNLADADNPAENLVGIAQSASQGAITSG